MPPLRQRLTGLLPGNHVRNAVGHALWPIWKWTKFGQVGVIMDTKVPTADDIDLQDVEIQFHGTPMERALAAETSSWVMACIRFRIAEIMNVNWSITDSSGNVIEAHPFYNAHRYARAAFGQDLFQRWMTMKLVHGAVYLEKLLIDGLGAPGGLRVLNSQYITPSVHFGQLRGYEYEVNGELYRYTLDQIFFDRFQHLRDDIKGKSPMDRALTNVNIDMMNQKTIKSYLLGDNKPGAVMALHPNARIPREEDRKKLLKEWKESGEGALKGYATRLISGPYTVTPFDTQAPDVMLSEDARRVICVEFGIDPALVGATVTTDPLGASTTLAEKRGLMIRYTIKPDLCELAEFINVNIMPWLTPDMDAEFRWDMTEIDATIRYSSEMVSQHRANFVSGIMKLNEMRDRLGLSNLGEDGEVFVLPQGFVYLRESKLGDFLDMKEAQMGISDDEELMAQIQRLSAPAPGADDEDDDESDDQEDDQESGSQSERALRELGQWERVALKDAKRAKRFVAHAIQPVDAAGILYQLELHDLSDRKTVKGLFAAIRRVLREEGSEAIKVARLFDPVLYADRLVTITESDVEKAVGQTEGDELLHDLLTASIDPDSVAIAGQPVDELEGGEL